MSDLSFLEKRALEKYLGMGGGYVLDFSNGTFADFIADSLHLEIYQGQYEAFGTSKANRLRFLWKHEPNHRVGKLIDDLLDYSEKLPHLTPQPQLLEECRRIASRLKRGATVEDLGAIQPNSDEVGFEALATAVKAAIVDNQPETGLDRLHTFTTKYLRTLNAACGLDTSQEKPLHSLMGQYLGKIRKLGLVESEMTVRILKSAISTLEAFNDVRNNQSFAHDNPTLNYEESLLIFNHVASTIRFLETVEKKRKAADAPEDDGDVPL